MEPSTLPIGASMTPDEGVMLKFGLKMPGGGFTVKQVGMDFLYASLCNNYLPGAYERLLLDAMQGDSMLYTRDDALEDWAHEKDCNEVWRQLTGGCRTVPRPKRRCSRSDPWSSRSFLIVPV